jgi:hypothetical protein
MLAGMAVFVVTLQNGIFFSQKVKLWTLADQE